MIPPPRGKKEIMKNIYVRLLQFLIGTDVDGDFGPNSEAAADRLIAELESYREAFDNVIILKAKEGEESK